MVVFEGFRFLIKLGGLLGKFSMIKRKNDFLDCRIWLMGYIIVMFCY